MANNSDSRSVFVGNIPHECDEEELKKHFGTVGPVISFRIKIDRDTNKSKGYGFCEYHDAETAQIAIKNLNNQTFGGRALRVDEASGRKDNAKEQPMISTTVNVPNDITMSPNDILESITKAVATLSPERIYEIMRELQTFLKQKPDEAREMLQNNPQLAYALLQAQVATNLVTQAEASQMMHKKYDNITPLIPEQEQTKQISQNVPSFGQSPEKVNRKKIQHERINIQMNAPPIYNSDIFGQSIHAPVPEMNPVPLVPPMHETHENFQNDVYIPQLPHSQGDFKPQNVAPQFGQPMNMPPHGVPSGPNLAPPMRSINNPGFVDNQYGNNNNNNRTFRGDQQINRGFEQQYGSNFNEPINQHFNENYYRNEEQMNRRYDNRQNMNYQNQGRNQPYDDNQYRSNNRNFQQQEPIFHGYHQNNFGSNRNVRTEDQSNQRFESYPQPEGQFPTEEFNENPYGNVHREVPRGQDFGSDRLRQNRGREQARNNRIATRPYDNNNRRNDGADRHNDNKKQPPQRPRPVDPRTAPRRQDQLSGQYQNH